MSKTVASAYVKAGKLGIVGVHHCALGAIPFEYETDILDTPDGVVTFGADTNSNVETAIVQAQAPIMNLVERAKMSTIAEQLVERARAGDQNAMAMISAVAETAKRGIERATVAGRAIKQYIDEHPVGTSDSHYPGQYIVGELQRRGSDNTIVAGWSSGAPDIYVGALALANNGSQFTHDRVVDIGSRFGDDSDAFFFGAQFPDKPCPRDFDTHVFTTGCIVGLAMRIQGVREGKLPVSALCPKAAWELGE